MEIRRLLITKDVVYSEARKNAPHPITRAIALAVMGHPGFDSALCLSSGTSWGMTSSAMAGANSD